MPTAIDRDQLLELLEQDGQLVEVLPASDFERGHLPGARNLPLEELSDGRAEQLLDPDRPVITYCNGFT